MSLVTQISSLTTEIGTVIKGVRTNIGSLGSLTTTNKSSLVLAVNEVKALVGAGSPTTLNDLTDVVIGSPLTGHIVRHNGTSFVNVLGSTFYDASGAAAAAQAASQPLNTPNLSAIAALSTTAYGRAFLVLANQAGLMGLLAPGSATAQGILELATTAETIAGTDTVRAVTPAGVAAAINALVDGAPGLLNTLDEIANALGDDPNFATTITASIAAKQAGHANLTAIAGLTFVADKMIYANGTGTLATANLTAFGRSVAALADAAAARLLIDVYSKAEIGDPNTDFVAVFNAALA